MSKRRQNSFWCYICNDISN